MRSYLISFAVLSVFPIGCGSSSSSGNEDASAGTVDSSVSGGPDASVTPDAAVDTTVRFIVMGDVGTGSDKQHAVAARIKDKCDADGCQFVVLLGDNIYDSGVDGTMDDQWRTKFREPYANIDLPFYAVLGNHDYGGEDPVFGTDQGGLGNEFDVGLHEVAYAQIDPKWNMPATHYTFQYGNVGFIMLDTNSILWDDTTHGDQRSWYPTALSQLSGADWIMAAGHHPLLSNGSHGNAGSYESIEILGVDLPITQWLGIDQLNGSNVKDFFDNTMCGTVDVSFSGHDHNRQWLNENDKFCGGELIVSGAGAKTKGWGVGGNEFHWQDETKPGFMYIVIDGDNFTGQFIDMDGVMNYERSFTR